MTTPDARERIFEAALASFRERGFAETTMREIASRAGVATGLAYYYFASKEAIVLAFYQRALQDLPALLDAAQHDRALPRRLHAVIEAKFAYFKPNRAFLGALMSYAANPASPLSPFSEASREIREFDVSQFERALAETHTRLPADLAPHMATLLWFYQMGLLLFWIYDTSPGQRRSYALLEASLKVVVTLMKLSNVPLLKPARKSVLNIIRIIEKN